MRTLAGNQRALNGDLSALPRRKKRKRVRLAAEAEGRLRDTTLANWPNRRRGIRFIHDGDIGQRLVRQRRHLHTGKRQRQLGGEVSLIRVPVAAPLGEERVAWAAADSAPSGGERTSQRRRLATDWPSAGGNGAIGAFCPSPHGLAFDRRRTATAPATAPAAGRRFPRRRSPTPSLSPISANVVGWSAGRLGQENGQENDANEHQPSFSQRPKKWPPMRPVPPPSALQPFEKIKGNDSPFSGAGSGGEMASRTDAFFDGGGSPEVSLGRRNQSTNGIKTTSGSWRLQTHQ